MIAMIIIVCLFSAFIARGIAVGKGRNATDWFAAGLLLGPLGVLFAFMAGKNQAVLDYRAIQSGEMRRCPHCAELIKSAAVVCKHCGRDADE